MYSLSLSLTLSFPFSFSSYYPSPSPSTISTSSPSHSSSSSPFHFPLIRLRLRLLLLLLLFLLLLPRLRLRLRLRLLLLLLPRTLYLYRPRPRPIYNVLVLNCHHTQFFWEQVRRCDICYPKGSEHLERFGTLITIGTQYVLPMTLAAISYISIIRVVWSREVRNCVVKAVIIHSDNTSKVYTFIILPLLDFRILNTTNPANR